MRDRHARLVISAPLVVSALALAGCMGSPTYGTGTQAHEQLLSDVTGVLSITPSKDKKQIAYTPRPELVRPGKGGATTLPQPQQNVAGVGGGAWPESPEQLRARLRAEATANQDNPSYVSPIAGATETKSGITSAARFGERGNFEVPTAGPDNSGFREGSQGITSSARFGERGNFEVRDGDGEKQREEFNKRLAESKQGSATTRKYLSEPPLTYRQPAGTAPSGDVGEDEWRKERRQKKAATGSSSWRDWVPGL